mmetsp:Transcript_34634/g.102902  ORF Transcript_34634/g.102902 Transcript_34634/m.102902 type:complete len:284 (-) Transcript_34634:330-1181(-)
MSSSMAKKCSGRPSRLCLAAAATLAVTATFASSAFVGAPLPRASGGLLVAERIHAQPAAASAAARASQRAVPSAGWQVIGAAVLLCASAAFPRRASKSSTGSRCRVVGCQAVPSPAAVLSVSAPESLVPDAPALIDLTMMEAKQVKRGFAAAPVSVAATAAAASPAEHTQSVPLGAPRRASARLVGGARRRQHSASDRTARASRAARRSVGARLQASAVAEPIVRSWDVSKVRAKIQHGLKLDACLHSRRSKDIKSPTNNKETCDDGVGISSSYFDNHYYNHL